MTPTRAFPARGLATWLPKMRESGALAWRRIAASRAYWSAWARTHAAFGGVLLLAAFFLTINIATPWQAVHETNGNVFTNAAISHIRYGLGVTKGQDYADGRLLCAISPDPTCMRREPWDLGQYPITATGPYGVQSANAYFQYYLTGDIHPRTYGDHPPLLGLTIAGSLLLFGYDFWAVRLVPILFSLLGLVLFYALARHLFDPVVARMAAAVYALVPMFDYFGRDVAHEAPTLACALGLLTGYVRWREDGRRRWVALMASATVIGAAFDWPLVYFALILFAFDWLVRRRPSRTVLLAVVLPALGICALILAQIAWALGGNLSTVLLVLRFRLSGGGVGGHLATRTWLLSVLAQNAQGFGAWSLFALPPAALLALTRARAAGWPLRAQAVALTGLWGLSHILLFRNGALYHTYWQFYLLPFYGLVLGWAAVALTRRVTPLPWLRAGALTGMLALIFLLDLSITFNLYTTNGKFALLSLLPFGR